MTPDQIALDAFRPGLMSLEKRIPPIFRWFKFRTRSTGPSIRLVPVRVQSRRIRFDAFIALLAGAAPSVVAGPGRLTYVAGSSGTGAQTQPDSGFTNPFP